MHRFNRGYSPVDFKKISSKFKTGDCWKEFAQNKKDFHSAIKDALYERQHRYCAYCESKIDNNDCHIEHLERRADVPGKTFDWNNLFLSCNCLSSCGKFKDALKGEKRKFNVDDIIDPSKENPLDYFDFRRSGEIVPVGSATPKIERKVRETVRIFNLNDPKLMGARSNAYRYAECLSKTYSTNGEIEERLENLPDDTAYISVYYAYFKMTAEYEERFTSSPAKCGR